ncbi:hypothetical protein TRVA0_001S02190 [Trichomonascus vanleenenianus]|uniref:uncharacterized protein n=1 Tax=Trichomonascus vanleenenianus TaxID=2268995 RepID=UPI003ECB9296
MAMQFAAAGASRRHEEHCRCHCGHSRRMSVTSVSSSVSRSGGSSISSLGYPVDPSRGQFLIAHVQHRDSRAIGNKAQFVDNSFPFKGSHHRINPITSAIPITSAATTSRVTTSRPVITHRRSSVSSSRPRTTSHSLSPTSSHPTHSRSPPNSRHPSPTSNHLAPTFNHLSPTSSHSSHISRHSPPTSPHSPLTPSHSFPERYRSPRRQSSSSSTSSRTLVEPALRKDKLSIEKERIAAQIRYQQQKEIERYELEKHRHRQIVKEREMQKQQLLSPNPLPATSRRHSDSSISQHSPPEITRKSSLPHTKPVSPSTKPKNHVSFAL